jgi:parallel beta-helix repeat protein
MKHPDKTTEPSVDGSNRKGNFRITDQAGSFATGLAARSRVFDEPRIPVTATTTPGDSGTVFKITSAGSFYLTAAVIGESGKSGIEIAAGRVVLDLNGFGIGVQDGSTVAGCTASFNEDVGVLPGAGSTVNNCTISDNDGDGIRPGDDTAVTGCTVRKNGGSGIQAPAGNRITGNLCDRNVAAGIRVLGSNNRIEGNNVTGNDRGLEIQASANTVAANVVYGNRDNYNISAGNQLNILLCQLPESIDWPASVQLAGLLTGVAGSNGITVNASDVTIDLGGHTLLGVPGSLIAIEVTRNPSGQRANICVKNGTVRDWGGGGVDAGSAANGHYRELRLLSNGTSSLDAGLACGSNGVIVDCSAMNNVGPGIAGANCCIRDCTVTGNGADGINVSSANIHDCTAFNNKNSGISAGWWSTIRECLARNNGSDGIVVIGDCHVINNNSTTNEGAGIRVSRAGQFNRIESNHVSDNKSGIVVQSPINLIIRNSAIHNADFDSPGPVLGADYDIVPGNTVGPFAVDLNNDVNPHANYFP